MNIRRQIIAVGCGLALAGCVADKAPPSVPDLGPEAGGKDDSATRPAITGPIGFDGAVSFALGAGGVNWRAWVFPGAQGQSVDAYAQGLNDTDTVLYLYKISRLTGRPYGRPLGYNDDSETTGWSLQRAPFNPYSSSIKDVTLPEDRDYALVVTTYQQAGGSALAMVHGNGLIYPNTIPAFTGQGAATRVVFADESTHATVLVANQVPVSSQVLAATRGGLQMSAAIYKADPTALAAILADGRYLGLAYGFLYGLPATSTYDASWTPVTANAAANALVTAWGDPPSGLLQQVTFILKSMFNDSPFRAGDVKVYRVHWDNGDDTNAEGIVAIKTSTGEIRVLSIVNPA